MAGFCQKPKLGFGRHIEPDFQSALLKRCLWSPVHSTECSTYMLLNEKADLTNWAIDRSISKNQTLRHSCKNRTNNRRSSWETEAYHLIQIARRVLRSGLPPNHSIRRSIQLVSLCPIKFVISEYGCHPCFLWWPGECVQYRCVKDSLHRPNLGAEKDL